MQAKLTNKPTQEVVAAIQALELESVKIRLMDPELGEGAPVVAVSRGAGPMADVGGVGRQPGRVFPLHIERMEEAIVIARLVPQRPPADHQQLFPVVQRGEVIVLLARAGGEEIGPAEEAKIGVVARGVAEILHRPGSWQQ